MHSLHTLSFKLYYLQDSGLFPSSLQIKVVLGLLEENMATALLLLTLTFLVILQGIPTYIQYAYKIMM